MNPADRAPLRDVPVPPPGGSNLAPVNTQYRGHFPLLEMRPATVGFNARQIFIYIRCWLLTKEVSFRVWWRG
jgi:hypothetical protein